MSIKIKKKIQIIFLVLLLISCKSGKKSEEIRMSFQKYLESRNINIEKLDDSNYADFYMDFLDFKTKSTLSKNSFLKLNKVYMYEGPNVITFCIFSDESKVYLNRINKKSTEYIIKTDDENLEIKTKFKLNFLGNFDLQDNLIKVSRNERELSGKERDDCDVGYIKGDSIHFIKKYRTKKFAYKKNWLAKTYKTDYVFYYQPNINITRFERTKDHNPYYLIEGFFKIELEPEKDRMTELLENAKF